MGLITDKDFDQFLDYEEEGNLVIDHTKAVLEAAKQRFVPDIEVVSYLPWEKTHSIFKFREGELTVWAGHTKSFKSMLTGYVLLYLAAQSERICIASLEMPVSVTVDRMMCQFTGNNNPSMDATEEYSNWGQGKLWYYSHRGTVSPRRIEALIHYCVQEKSMTHIMIDSLMMMTLGEDEYRCQKDLVVKLSSLAKDYSIHIHLVTHMRKPSDAHRAVTMYDILGTSNIPNIADNIFLISKPNDPEKPDIFLDLCAQRLGETHTWGLWLHDSFQFHPFDNSGYQTSEDVKAARFL